MASHRALGAALLAIVAHAAALVAQTGRTLAAIAGRLPD
jgi:hypothetical protein